MPDQMLPVTIIGTGTGDGGPPMLSGTVASTPGTMPNVRFNVVRPAIAIVVRFGHTFGNTLAGLVVAGMTPAGSNLIGASDFWGLVQSCAQLALAPAALGLIKDTVTIFARLEGQYPLITGNV